jgi:hypothetical protein
MTTAADIKNDLHRMVVETNDTEILARVRAFFTSLRKETDWWDELSEEDIALIELGEQQLDEGITVTNEDVRAKVEAKLRQQ